MNYEPRSTRRSQLRIRNSLGMRLQTYQPIQVCMAINKSLIDNYQLSITLRLDPNGEPPQH